MDKVNYIKDKNNVTKQIEDLNATTHAGKTDNPHGVTKSQVGLGSVVNTGDSATPVENGTTKFTTGGAYTELNKKADKTTTVNGHALSGNVTVTKSDVGLGNVTNDSQVKRSEMGVASGVATLDSSGKVPSSQLPAFVDDIIEGYLSGTHFYKEAAHTNIVTDETGASADQLANKVYLDLATNKSYRWSGSAYGVIGSDLALGETSSTAYRGDRGKTAYDHSQSTHARTDATKTEASSTNGNIKINGTETVVYTHPTTTAAAAAAVKVGKDAQGHVVLGNALTKGDIGLGNVGNFKAVSTVASQGLTDTEKGNARTNIAAAGIAAMQAIYAEIIGRLQTITEGISALSEELVSENAWKNIMLWGDNMVWPDEDSETLYVMNKYNRALGWTAGMG